MAATPGLAELAIKHWHPSPEDLQVETQEVMGEWLCHASLGSVWSHGSGGDAATARHRAMADMFAKGIARLSPDPARGWCCADQVQAA